jgi:hypothetical protein
MILGTDVIARHPRNLLSAIGGPAIKKFQTVSSEFLCLSPVTRAVHSSEGCEVEDRRMAV